MYKFYKTLKYKFFLRDIVATKFGAVYSEAESLESLRCSSIGKNKERNFPSITSRQFPFKDRLLCC